LPRHHGTFFGDPELYALPVVDAESNPIALVDRKYFVEFFSKLYTKDIFGPRSIRDLLAYDDYQNVNLIVLEETCSVDEATRIIVKAGPEHMVNGFIVSSQGKYIGVANGLDLLKTITEGEKILLKESEARSRSIVETAFDGVMTHDSGIILEANLRFAQLFGYESPAELIGLRGLDLLLSPETRKQMSERMASGDITPIEIVCRRKDGSTFVGETQSCDSVFRGKHVRTVALRDLTSRKLVDSERARLELQLRESQKMEALGTLAGGVAHDFNNIIASILGNAELASEDARDNPEAARQSIEEIRRAGRRARELVQQILAFSRRQPTARRTISLVPIVEESVRMLRATLPARISLEVQCDAQVPQVLADATQIQQILINLANNATHAIGGNPGRIQFFLDTVLINKEHAIDQPRLRVVHDKSPGPVVRLVVADTGYGMDRETQKRIFEPFFTTKPVGEGTGLGLSVVLGIVESHEGAIVVQSEPGKGARFTVYLPVASAAMIAATLGNIGPEGVAVRNSRFAAGKHILYVDDDSFMVTVIKSLLERRKLRVSAYLDQDQALASLRANPGDFDLVVTDYNMPGMSGLDVAREVRRIRSDLPVVVASGFVDEELQAKAQEAGVREVIFKAEAMEGFYEVILRILVEAGECSTSF
jgi:PAS domain S-box-containing protein